MAFSEKEIGAYYRALNRDAGEAGDVFAYTNGLAIFVNALAQGPAILSRKYGMRVLDRYLRKYLWDEWDEERRAFMMASAAVDEMPITLCEKITGRADAGALLETLRADNVFVARVEDGVYRYHHLFLDFLRAQPEYERMDKTKGWRAAAEYYLDAKEYFVARSYAYRSGHIKTILSCLYALLQNRGISLDDHFEIESILSTPEMEALCERYPVLYISRAWVAFMHGDAAAFERHVDKLKSNLPMILLKYPRFAETLLMMIVLDYRTPFATQIKQAGKLPPIKFAGEELRATTLSIQMPFMHRSCRDFYELADTRLHDGLKKTFGKLLKSHYEMIM
ncbi:MAG TPA: hypothetical protein DEB31_05125, partial [Clostridiales bacterium]|nr:hypothetical protein [Clostridiales bacterium]